jgi:hypothetical protein
MALVDDLLEHMLQEADNQKKQKEVSAAAPKAAPAPAAPVTDEWDMLLEESAVEAPLELEIDFNPYSSLSLKQTATAPLPQTLTASSSSVRDASC